MKKLKHLFTALLLLCGVGTATAHDFVGGGIFYNITNDTNKTVEVTYNGSSSGSYNEYTGSVVIPESVTYNGTTYSVTSIGKEAFSRCTGLTSITIPNSVTSIGVWAFEDCISLRSVHISDLAAWCNIAFAGAYSNPLYFAHNLYLNGELVTGLVIPDGVTEIKKYAFSGCSDLTGVEIPSSVTSIGDYAFSYCTELTSITSLIPAESLFDINSYVFYNVDKTFCTLFVPVGTKEAYASTKGWKDFVNIVEMDFTGIEDVEAEGERAKTVYDLQGRKVEVATEGLYIIDGKKVLVK